MAYVIFWHWYPCWLDNSRKNAIYVSSFQRGGLKQDTPKGKKARQLGLDGLERQEQKLLSLRGGYWEARQGKLISKQHKCVACHHATKAKDRRKWASGAALAQKPGIECPPTETAQRCEHMAPVKKN